MPGSVTATRTSLRLLAAAALAALAAGVTTPAQAASGSVKCPSGKTYTASVPGGSCRVGANWVKCTGSNSSDTASVSCVDNPAPCNSGGNGSCKSERQVMGDGATAPGAKLRQRPELVVPDRPALRAN